MKTKILLAFAVLYFISYYANAQGGTLTLNGSSNGTISTTGQTDFWSVTATQNGNLSFTLTNSGSSDFYAQLYASDGTTLLGSQIEAFTGSGNTASTTVNGLAPGIYKIKIFPYSTSTGNYTISNTFATPSQATDAEPDNYANQALTLALNDSTGGQLAYNNYIDYKDSADWYKFTTNADGRLRITLQTNIGTNSSSADFYAELYTGDTTTQLGSTIEAFVGSNNSAVLNVDGLAPGSYYIKIFPYAATFGTYSIADSLFTPSQATDAEPNDYAKQSLTLALNDGAAGQLAYNNYIDYKDSTDWYKLTTNTNGRLRITLQTNIGTNSSSADFYAQLYATDTTTQLGSTIEAFVGSNNSAVLNVDGLAPGSYYIKIFPYSTRFGTYSIADSLFTPSQITDAEPNDNANQAITLALNDNTGGQLDYNNYVNYKDLADWYKVTTNADGQLRITLQTNVGTNSTSADFYAQLYDNDTTIQLGNNIEAYTGSGNVAALNVDGLAAGTYYIKLFPYAATFGTYTLSDSLFAATIPNDAEPNGSPATAITVPINTSNIKGHSGYYYNNQRDTSDYYKVTTTSTGSLRIILSTLRGSVYSTNTLDFNVYLYNADGTTQAGYKEIYSGGNPATDSLVVTGLAAGTYYIKIQTYFINEFGDYSLAVLNGSGVLPVTYLNFDGVLSDGRALLTWSTATEINNKGFEIEKSTDGQTFTNIGFVDGHVTSSVINTYNYTDIKVLSGYNYYRLKQVDIDDNFNYSTTIRLDFKNFAWSIFGNPVTANSWIQLQIANSSKIVFQVYTINGKLIQTIDKGILAYGTYSIPFNLGNAPAGVYIIKLISGDLVFSKEVIKQN